MPENENNWVALAIGSSSRQFIELFLGNLATISAGHGLDAVGVHEINIAPKVRQDVNKRITKAQADDISIDPTIADDELTRLGKLRDKAAGYEPKSVLIVIDVEYLGRVQADGQHASGADVNTLLFTNLKTIARPDVMVAICISRNTGSPDEIDEQAAYNRLEEHTRSQAKRPPVLDAAFIVRTDSPLKFAVGGENEQNNLLAKSLAGVWTAPLYGQNPDIRSQGADMRRSARQGDGMKGLDTKTFIGMAVRTDGITMERPKGPIGRLLYPMFSRTTWFIKPQDAANAIAATTYALLENWPAPRTTVEPYPYRGPVNKGPDIHEVPISVNLIVPFRANGKPGSKFAEVARLVRARLTNSRRVHPWTDRPAVPAAPAVTERGFRVNVLSNVQGSGVQHLGSRPGQFYYQVCVLFPIDQDQISTGETVDPPQATQETRMWVQAAEETADEAAEETADETAPPPGPTPGARYGPTPGARMWDQRQSGER